MRGPQREVPVALEPIILTAWNELYHKTILEEMLHLDPNTGCGGKLVKIDKYLLLLQWLTNLCGLEQLLCLIYNSFAF